MLWFIPFFHVQVVLWMIEGSRKSTGLTAHDEYWREISQPMPLACKLWYSESHLIVTIVLRGSKKKNGNIFLIVWQPNPALSHNFFASLSEVN